MWNPTAFMVDNCDKQISVIEENFPGKIFIRSLFLKYPVSIKFDLSSLITTKFWYKKLIKSKN